MNKRLVRQIVFFLMASLTVFIVTMTHVVAQEIAFYWDDINVTIDVQTNGDMLVTETQKYVFTAAYTNQRYRYIPLDQVDEIKDVTVEENNRTIPSSTEIENNQFWIRWQHELKPPKSHIFVLKYRVVGGLHVDGENTLVYWKAIAAGSKAPVNTAKVRVQLPKSLSGKVLSFTNSGVPAIPRQVDPQTFEFVASQSLQSEQELEVKIAFPKQILNLPEPRWQQTRNPPQPSSGEEGFFLDFAISVLGFFQNFAIIISIAFLVIFVPIAIGSLLLLVIIFIFIIIVAIKKPINGGGGGGGDDGGSG